MTGEVEVDTRERRRSKMEYMHVNEREDSGMVRIQVCEVAKMDVMKYPGDQLFKVMAKT